MKKELIITKDGSHSLFVPDLNETYHSVHGSISEAIHVFINNGLLSHPKKNINILEIGFGTGLNTLLTLENIKNRKVHYTSLDPYPISSEIYNKLNFHSLINSDSDNFLELHTSDWEEEVFISENFTLYKTQKKIQNFISKKKFDVIYFDAFSPEKQTEMWTTEMAPRNSIGPGASATSIIFLLAHKLKSLGSSLSVKYTSHHATSSKAS